MEIARKINQCHAHYALNMKIFRENTVLYARVSELINYPILCNRRNLNYTLRYMHFVSGLVVLVTYREGKQDGP